MARAHLACHAPPLLCPPLSHFLLRMPALLRSRFGPSALPIVVGFARVQRNGNVSCGSAVEHRAVAQAGAGLPPAPLRAGAGCWNAARRRIQALRGAGCLLPGRVPAGIRRRAGMRRGRWPCRGRAALREALLGRRRGAADAPV
ncbi:unnamed protein product, partial [Prorocentrum cordatum]